jgi:hypothetical protein
MKSLHVTLCILGVFLSRPGLALQEALPAANQGSASGEVAVQEVTPAQQRIAAAKRQIAADPKKVQAYNELAIAFLRRTR